jgi:hypothetical protein
MFILGIILNMTKIQEVEKDGREKREGRGEGWRFYRGL